MFIQKHSFPYFGIMSISAVLKRQGVRTDVLISSLEKNIIKQIKESSSDIIGISAMSPDHNWLVNLVERIKNNINIPIVVGGVHASACPEIIDNPNVDYVIMGDGEYVFLKFIEGHFNNHRDKIIDGLISKDTDKDQYFVSPGYINDLNQLPFEDRAIYYNKYPALRNLPLKQFISSRGCPFDCTYCFNPFYKDLLSKKGKFVRRKSPEYLIEEIKRVKNNYGCKSLHFAEDFFILDNDWVLKFCGQYVKEIGLPFMCSTVASLMTDDIAKMLKKAGCSCVTFGIETGNEEKRKNILNKKISNYDIKKCADYLKKYKIKIDTSNIFGFPGETIDDAFETIRLNAEIGTDYMLSSLMMPYPKTGIEKIAREQKILPNNYDYSDLPDSFFSRSVFRLKDIEVLENIHKISFIAMKLPKCESFFRWIVKKNWKKLFFAVFSVSFIYIYKTEKKLSVLDTIKLVWRYRKSY